MMKQLFLFLLFGCFATGQGDEVHKLVDLTTTSLEQILEDEGEIIRVKGFVASTRTNATGIHFLEFKNTEFVCVTFGRQLGAFTEGAPSEIYRDKWLEVTGEIEKYRGLPQIRLTSPDQVKVLDEPKPVDPPKETPPVIEEVTSNEVEVEVVTKPTPPLNSSVNGRELEVVDGVPAVDWRKYFPELTK